MPKTSRRSVQVKNKIICIQCKLAIKEESEESIECDKCSKTFHIQCTHLDKREYQYLLNNESELFTCHLCEGGDKELRNELRQIKTKLDKLDQLSELQTTMQFMSKQYDELLKGVVDNKKKLKEVEKENVILKREVKELKSAVKVLNDNRVKNDCIVSGLNVESGVPAADTIINLSKEMGVVLDKVNIEDAFYLRNKRSNNQKKTAIVKFTNKNSKDKLMSLKSKLGKNESTTSVYINDLLCKETLDLLNYAKALKNVGYKFVYARNGRVFYKRSEICKAQVINTTEDVDQIILSATTNKRFSRNQIESYAANVFDDDDGSGDDGDNGAQYVSPN